MIKKLINKKLYLILLLLILIIVMMISCKKINILGPNNIPPPTDFRLPEDTIPGHIDVNPVLLKTEKYSEVFRGSLNIKANGMY